ncbi:MAG: gliding motility protein GldL [Bacteroidales bacterium]|nr:gliding motility protein GldL [Bacteroidales bacterium]
MSFIDKMVRSKAYKNFMSKLYGWGAAVVIVGALFKINHWPGAVPMLIIGMGTESIIFFLSAFEPLHVEWDWSLVYPELAGMHDQEEEEQKISGGHAAQLAGGVSSDPLTQQLDKMLEDAKIGPELIDRLGQGMQNLADSATSLNNMSTAVAATDKFVSGMDNAASAADELSQAYRRTTESMNSDINLSAGYSESLKDATAAVSTLSNIYKETAQTLQKGDASYLDELKKMATSLSSINAMYEIQIQNSTSQLEATKEVQERIQNMVANFADSAEGMMKYKDQVDALTRKVSELNNVYGNMLAAMHARV